MVGGVGGSCNIRVMTCGCTLRIRPELTSEREYFLCQRENILCLREYLFGQKIYFPLSETKYFSLSERKSQREYFWQTEYFPLSERTNTSSAIVFIISMASTAILICGIANRENISRSPTYHNIVDARTSLGPWVPLLLFLFRGKDNGHGSRRWLLEQ